MSDWTDAAITKLQQLANEGYSASQIATLVNKELGTEFTRNAIVGKLHRLGRGVSGERKVAIAWSARMIGALDTALGEGLTLQACARHVSAVAGQEIDPQHVHAKIEDIRKRQERAEAREQKAQGRKAISRLFPAPAEDTTEAKPRVDDEVVPVVPFDEPLAPLAGDPVSLLGLKDWHCRWPGKLDEDGLTTYCGARKFRGAYCGHHARMAYQPPPERKVKAPLPVYRIDKTFARFA